MSVQLNNFTTNCLREIRLKSYFRYFALKSLEIWRPSRGWPRRGAEVHDINVRWVTAIKSPLGKNNSGGSCAAFRLAIGGLSCNLSCCCCKRKVLILGVERRFFSKTICIARCSISDSTNGDSIHSFRMAIKPEVMHQTTLARSLSLRRPL